MSHSSQLSSRQQAILDYIKQEVREKGYPPSVREIGEAVGLASSSTVHGHLNRLEKKGLIRRDPTKPRAIEVLDPNDLIPDLSSPDDDGPFRWKSDRWGADHCRGKCGRVFSRSPSDGRSGSFGIYPVCSWR